MKVGVNGAVNRTHEKHTYFLIPLSINDVGRIEGETILYGIRMLAYLQ